MKYLLLQPDFDTWREAAREALRLGFRPDEIDLQDASVPTTLALSLSTEESPTGPPINKPHVSRGFLAAAKYAAAHRDPQRWNLLYRMLYRLQSDRDLLRIEVDPDVDQLLRLEGQVRRDLHKMHAFVRFRKVLEPGEPAYPEGRPVVVDEPVLVADGGRELATEHHLLLATPTPFGVTKTEISDCWPEINAATAEVTENCEHFIAWYQPDHRILSLAAPFFAERFAVLRWSILTPDASASWDPVKKKLTFSPGLPREAAPAEDELEELWRTYYASIFNPARLNPETMRSEMPVRYWKDLPEVTLLPNLITKAQNRVASMVTRQEQQPTAQPFVPTEHTIKAIHKALPSCEGCELYKHATQVVPGNGPHDAHLMLVGEQPGDQEDLQGLPFVGPAGKLLRRAFDELDIDPATIYVTNAVKHFKFVQRGKLRLHQNPRMSEITACRPWLEAEIDAARPKVILCLGASAAKSLLGGTFGLMKDRGKLLSTRFAEHVMATIHPSAILRARDDESRDQLYEFLKTDLALAYQTSARLVSKTV
jgi:uracil-DNA glycosylase family protein